MIEIRKSTFEDYPTLLKLYKQARYFMAENGNPLQWGSSYPEPEQIVQDIQEQNSYVGVYSGRIVAVFYYRYGVDICYEKIHGGAWLNDSPYGVVHRITSDGTVKGAASFCLNWAFKQCHNLKIDTHRDNHIMQHTLEKNGFSLCGVIFTDDGTEKLAYQKCL